MSSLFTLTAMCILLGFGSFGIGILPLSFALSKHHTNLSQALGTGLLLGTAIGVIIPEGIESLASSHSSSDLPTSKIALSLLLGFTFMLIVDQWFVHDSHIPYNAGRGSASVEYDVECRRLEPENVAGQSEPSASDRSDLGRAYPLTLGLVVHGLADGLALGVSALSAESGAQSNLSFVVFLALLIHKAPTALALTTNLMATTLPWASCRNHLAAFSASTPLGALVSYGILSLILGADQGRGNLTGMALLISGGSFLYVATVLQPVSSESQGIRLSARLGLIVIGMYIPFAISWMLGHGHRHGDAGSLRV